MNAEQYYEALRQFEQRGNRYAMIPRLTWIGKAIGLTADDIISHARNAGVKDKDSAIRSMWNGAKVLPHTTSQYCRKRSITPPCTKPVTYPTFVKRLIENAVGNTREALMKLSPVNVANMTDRESATAQLEAMFNPDELILVGTMKKKVCDRDLRPLKVWLNDSSLLTHEQVKINPFTGKLEEGGSKGYTRFGNNCVARHSFILLEFDELSLDKQYAFWSKAVTLKDFPVTAIVYSGKRSLHGLIRVNASNRKEWDKSRDQLIAYFCTANDEPYKADRQALGNLTCAIRLAGVQREGGEKQTLLYLNPNTP